MTELPSWHPDANGKGHSGSFKPGHKVGRPKGAKDRIPNDLKKDFIEALKSFGSDGKGKDGFEGFVHYAIQNDLRGVLRVVAKIIPLQIKADVTGSNIANIIINSVPPNHFVKEDPQGNGVIIDGRVIADSRVIEDE
jgi:hypothetical protein